MDIRDDAGFFAALDANEELPYGKTRTARAEVWTPLNWMPCSAW